MRHGLEEPVNTEEQRKKHAKDKAASDERRRTGAAPPIQQASKCSICSTPGHPVTGHTAANQSFHPKPK